MEKNDRIQKVLDGVEFVRFVNNGRSPNAR